MKTSFYFVFWIVIYPILGLFHNPVIAQNSFIVALVLAFGLSWLLNRLMPNTFAYERKLQVSPILSDIYEGKVDSFKRRIRRNTIVSVVTAVYFLIVTFIIVAFSGKQVEWFSLLIFGFLSFGYISRSATMYKAYLKLKDDPTPEQCMEIAVETLHLNYSSYYEERMQTDGKESVPAPPRNFKAFQIFSLIFAALAVIFGLFCLVMFVLALIGDNSLVGAIFAGASLLYASLALYFGISDFIAIRQEMKFIKTRL